MKPQDIQRGKSSLIPPAVPQVKPEVRILNFENLNSIQTLLSGNWLRPGMTLEIPFSQFLGFNKTIQIFVTEENIGTIKNDLDSFLSSELWRKTIDAPRTFFGKMVTRQFAKNLIKKHLPEYANMGWWEAIFG